MMGTQYISSNELNFKFCHTRKRTFCPPSCSIGLENRQRVYFTGENVLQIALNYAPQNLTVTEFFRLCKKSDFFSLYFLTRATNANCTYMLHFYASRVGKPSNPLVLE